MASIMARKQTCVAKRFTTLLAVVTVSLISFGTTFVGQQPQMSIASRQMIARRSTATVQTAEVAQELVKEFSFEELPVRVQKLREASLAACLQAHEDSSEDAMQACAILSYELSTAETLLNMRTNKVHHTWTDSDSF
eukprot:TRINITY_DN83450_c0_g1_i1.p1 TRINITY_DN83450_c0_g1~~TRINITY_DN83450_c0_g1_i1.p1  ORF type:complete len:137 (+),score=28.16 TRINITY_DN83450_c0_g1_i1:147-557(+)